mgnify:CR=1 FL=1
MRGLGGNFPMLPYMREVYSCPTLLILAIKSENHRHFQENIYAEKDFNTFIYEWVGK